MKYLSVFFASLFSICGFAQTVLENNPPSLKWSQIRTPHFKVIFPAGFDEQASRMANTLEHIYEPEAQSLGSKPRRISVVLQNQSAVSNGFVSITPRRSEFYAMPSQNYNFLGNNDWLNLLAAHEYRHIVQFQHANRGFNKAIYYLFGANTLAAMSYAAAPQWFWEGDAVATETAFTRSGRGRIPNFGVVFKANLMEGRTFNYHKQYLRSYKHNIPDHYVFGYYMVNYLREKTGDADVWGKITRRSWSVPFIPFAFSNAVKKESGKYVAKLYKEMAADLQSRWKAEQQVLDLTPFETITKRKNTAYTDYLFPAELPDGKLLAMRKGIGDIEEFVLISGDKTTKVFTPGIMNETGMLSVNNNKIAWNEFHYDARWGVRNYSVIKIFDVSTRKLSVVSEKSRYGGVALSPDGTRVATVETDVNYKHRLVVLDVVSGQVIRSFPNTDNAFYSMPRWSQTGQEIVALKTANNKKSVVIFSQNGTERTLIPASEENIGHPVLTDQFLFFNSPASGIDNIYAVDIKSNQRYQITSSKYGAYNPSLSADGKFILYNEQTKDGLDVVKTRYEPGAWKPHLAEPIAKSFYQHLVEQEGRPQLFDSIPSQSFTAKKYSRLKGLVNPYSWGPFFNNTLTAVDVGISSRDVLSTTEISAGYRFDLNERTGLWRASVSYQGWFPIIDVAVSYGKRAVNEGDFPGLIVDGTDSTFVTFQDVTAHWTEKNTEIGLRVPLVTTRSRFIGNVTIGNAVGFSSVSDFRLTSSNFSSLGSERYVPAIVVNDTIRSIYPQFDYVGNNTLVYNHFSFSAYRLMKQSRRDINSKWGQAVYIDLYSTPASGDLKGNLFSFYSILFFPGLFKNHSFWGYWAYQSVFAEYQEDSYLFRNNIPLPRGYTHSRFGKFYSMSANYTLPVWYPDMALGPLLNVQRVRVNGFLDYGFGTNSLYRDLSQSYVSVGGEVKFDFNVFRFLPQLNVGFRYAKGINPASSQFEILIGTFNF